MKLSIFILLLTPILSWGIDQSTWENYLREEIIPSQEFFEEINFLKPWRNDSDFVISTSMRMVDRREKIFRCQTNNLWPSHPYQSTKEYHAALRAEYDYTRLPATSMYCTIPNPTRRFCQRAAAAKLVITSDLYVDDCGNHYRGFWLTAYASNFESMGTLFAKGRTAYERAGSSFRGDFVTGATYGLKRGDFLYLSELSPKDHTSLSRALNGIDRFFKKRGKIFLPR